MTRPFLTALLLNTLWINASEVFRYFVFVMPMMRAAFPEIPDIAPMSLPVFLFWGLWDTILIITVTAFGWLMFTQFGHSMRVTFAIATALWLAIFGILWLGLWNMNLATIPILVAALPLAWLELVIATFITRHFHGRAVRLRTPAVP